ncbi:MAG: HAD family hydrolase [Candidatus Latescibacteria bacterium]|nr:HAD family hydrolase [Candidatus Latescibacterota bacterium]
MEIDRRVAAFFDVDGTILKTIIIHYYVHFATEGRSRFRRCLFWTGFVPQLLSYLVIDWISRSAFNRLFYRRYRGMEMARLQVMAERLFAEEMTPRLFPEAVARVRAHRARGERVVFVTGSLDFIITPLARHLGVADVIAVRMVEREGRLTGYLTGPPVGDEEKARLIQKFAQAEGIDLAASAAYGDSSADLPMLRCVGHPVAVNPGKRLRREAEARGWEIVGWRV